MPFTRLAGLLRRWPVAAGCGVLAGCSSSVIVESEFPTPLVEPLPVSMGVIFDDDLYNFIYTEDIPDQSTWTIALGDANIALLRPLFDTMFADMRIVDTVPVDGASAAGLDGVLQPVLEKFEFDVPIGERDEFVEVWMQYKLTLFEPQGDIVAEWPVSGYGKYELGRDREDAVRRAAIVAMREVGAAISTKFAEQPQVRYWLGERRNEAATTGEVQAVETRLNN